MKKIAVIGGGAAGFFAAIWAKRTDPGADVRIYEKSHKLLSKVIVSGGGRCNVTHDMRETANLLKHYPRGKKLLKAVFRQFAVQDCIDFFESCGVELKTEADGRMFPVTDDSHTIAGALETTARSLGIRIAMNTGLDAFRQNGEGAGLELDFSNGESESFHRVVIACGGFPNPAKYNVFKTAGIPVVAPVPSLFTFNIPERGLHALMGVSVKHVRLRLQGRKEVHEGPLLITHWGLSGPAVLRSSAWEAECLNAQHYKFNLHLDWTGLGEAKARAVWAEMKKMHPKKKLANADPYGLPERLRQFLLERAGANGERIMAELPKADENRLLEQYLNGIYVANGKTTYKEEFVTAGGVSTDAVDHGTMECTAVPGLYFAGEILDVDGITGGFNFQAAWSTGFVAGLHAAK